MRQLGKDQQLILRLLYPYYDCYERCYPAMRFPYQYHTHTIAKHAHFPSLRIPNPDCETLGKSEDGVRV